LANSTERRRRRAGENDTYDQTDSNVEGDGEPPGEGAGVVLGTLSDTGSENLSEGEEELPRGDHSSSDGDRRDLGKVESDT
jgi:hypothetical protein